VTKLGIVMLADLDSLTVISRFITVKFSILNKISLSFERLYLVLVAHLVT